MLTLRDPSEVPLIANPAIRHLLDQRFQQLNVTVTSLPSVEFIVLEGGEPVSAIEKVAGFPILTSLFEDLPFGHPDFYPCTEILEEHIYEQHRIYEMVFISNDDGAATAIFVPDEEGIDANLLALCRSWATPSVSAP